MPLRGDNFPRDLTLARFVSALRGCPRGRRATTHWAYVDLLPLVGASYEKGRVVRDGNIFTSDGVTSGIDFAFRIVAEFAGSEVAQAIQFAIEHDPFPPLDAGRPDRAPEAATTLMVQRNEKARESIREAGASARASGRTCASSHAM
jgi:cyclohexyl-isocyanide hydratase